MPKELKFDAAAVRETLRNRSQHRGVTVRTAKTIPTGSRVGGYKPQSEKRKDYHAI